MTKYVDISTVQNMLQFARENKALVSVRFIKRTTGDERAMLARFSDRGVSGAGSRYNPVEKRLSFVLEQPRDERGRFARPDDYARARRSIPWDSVTYIRVNGREVCA